MICYVLFAEPGSIFQGLHRTIDGAVHRAAALGAIATECGGEMFVDDITKIMAGTSAFSFYCADGEEFTHVRIERHGIYL
jgi:hypothetical protein